MIYNYNLYIILLLIFANVSSIAQQTESDVDHLHSEKLCTPLWQDHIFGECAGNNDNLIVYDYDSDGVDELIVNANIAENPRHGFWYILKYNSISGQYEKVFTSALFEGEITQIALSTSGDYPRLCMSSLNKLFVYNLSTFKIENQLLLDEVSWVGTIQNLDFKDITEDGVDDIIANGFDWMKIIDGANYKLLTDRQGDFTTFNIGNVDDDEHLEIVFANGIVFEVNKQGELTEEYTFVLDFASGVEILLEDIDNDGKDEGILGLSNNRIEIIDLETGNIKYEIPSFFGVNTMTTRNVVGSDLPELIVSVSTEGILIYDLENGDLINSFDVDINQIPSIAISDFDNDGEFEMVYGTRCGSSDDDIIYVMNIETGEIEFQSKYVKGDFFGIEVEDIDEDGRKELIVMTGKNFDSGGTLYVYDAITKELKFTSEEEFLPDSKSESRFIEIIDYGQDGDLDIIIGGGNYIQGEIWVVDGATLTLEYKHSFLNEINRVTTLQKFKFADGIEDLIMTGDNYIYRISSIDLSIKWKIEDPTFYPNNLITTHDILDDGQEEIIVTNSIILVFDQNGEYQFQSNQNTYSVTKSMEWGVSNTKQIIAGTWHGEIFLLDENLERTKEYKVSESEILNILGADLNNDGINELIIGTEDELIFLTEDGRIQRSPIGKEIGKYDAFKYLDYDNDGIKSLFVGSRSSVMEVDLSCINCLFATQEIIATNPICGLDNGIIEILQPESYSTILFDEIEIEGSVDSLDSGNYSIILEETNGCKHFYEVSLFDELLDFDIHLLTFVCPGEVNGTVIIDVTSGSPGYSYILSDSIEVSDTIENLNIGPYSITVTDANGCTVTKTFFMHELILTPVHAILTPDDDQTSQPDGSIQITNPNSTFLWEDGSTESFIDNLSNGVYNVTFTDSNGCVQDTTFHLGPTGVGEENGLDNISLKPNPATDYVYFNWPNETIEHVSIISSTGKFIKDLQFDKFYGGDYGFDISGYNSGVYFISVKNKSSQTYKKLVILNK